MEMERGTATVPPGGNAAGAGRTAVVCEDDDAVLRALESMLANAGFQVVASVATGLELVRAAGELSPRVAVVDLALSGSLGVRIVGVLAAASPGLAVVVLTTFRALEAELLEAGAAAVVALDDLRGLEALLAELVETD